MQLNVTYDGVQTTHTITPLIEYHFEREFKDGLGPTLSKGRNSDVYWLAWECLRDSGVAVPPFGDAFLTKLGGADFAEEPDRPNG